MNHIPNLLGKNVKLVARSKDLPFFIHNRWIDKTRKEMRCNGISNNGICIKLTISMLENHFAWVKITISNYQEVLINIWKHSANYELLRFRYVRELYVDYIIFSCSSYRSTFSRYALDFAVAVFTETTSSCRNGFPDKFTPSEISTHLSIWSSICAMLNLFRYLLATFDLYFENYQFKRAKTANIFVRLLIDFLIQHAIFEMSMLFI